MNHRAFQIATARHLVGLEDAPDTAPSILPPAIIAAARSEAFPKLGGALVGAIMLGARVFWRDPSWGAEWTKRAKWHLERIAEVTDEDTAAKYARRLGTLVLAFGAKDPRQLSLMYGARIADKEETREDLVELARDLVLRRQLVGAPTTFLPCFGVVPGRPGILFNPDDGKANHQAAGPFPARRLVVGARRGSPFSRRYIAGVLNAARRGDPNARHAAGALADAAKLADRTRFVAHYRAVAAGLFGAGPLPMRGFGP